MRKTLKRSYVSIVLIAGVFLMFSGQVALGAPERKAWDLIEWNKPVSMVERLDADKYILPEGWKEATKGVEKLVLLNAGGLAHDIATAINMERFEQLTGIKMEAVAVPGPLEHTKSLATLLGRDGSVHLILMGGPEREVTTFAREEWIVPVDFLWPPEVQKLYSRTVGQVLQHKGHWWGGQTVWQGFGLVFYRPSWLQNAGVDVPTTWEDLYIAAKKSRAWGSAELGPSYYGAVFPGVGINFMQPFPQLVHTQGGKLYQNGKPQYLSPEVKSSFEYFVKLVQEDVASEEVLNYTYNEMGQAFGMGQAAFIIGNTTAYVMKYQTEFPVIKGDWDVIPPPKWSAESPGEYGSGVTSGNAHGVNAYSPDNYQAAAALFLDYVRSREATRFELVVEGNGTFFLDQYRDPKVCQKVDWNLVDKTAEKIGIPHPPRMEKLPFANTRAIMVETASTEQYPLGFPMVLDIIQEQFAKAALGVVSVEEALKAIQDFAEQIPTG